MRITLTRTTKAIIAVSLRLFTQLNYIQQMRSTKMPMMKNRCKTIGESKTDNCILRFGNHIFDAEGSTNYVKCVVQNRAVK